MTGNMNYGRIFHTVTVLTNGKVLVPGDFGNSSDKSIELYDPLTGIWSIMSDMNYAREHHRASLLLNGKILVTGGRNITALNSAELY